ncbi:MAG: hypothetical protein ACJ8DZ_09875 [Allosphingosinicella sp.]
MLAFLLLVAAPLPSPATGARADASDAEMQSAAAAEAFREGCERGALRLTPERGRILKDTEVGEFTQVLDWGRRFAKRTVVKFTHPRSTYMIIAEYDELQPKGFSRVCVLVSKILSDRDASRALIESTPEIRPLQTWIPDMHVPEWILDVPKQGYRKRMAVRDDGSILLEVATYAVDPSTPSSQARQP